MDSHTKSSPESDLPVSGRARNSTKRLAMRAAALSLAFGLLTASCGATDEAPPSPETLTLVTHQSFAVSEGIIETFEAQHGITVEILRSDDAGAMLNQAILTKGNPLGDVIFGIDNTFLSRALDAGILEPYESPQLAAVPDDLELDPGHRATPIDFGDVCVNYDRSVFADADAPESLLELAGEPVRGMLVVENPATSSPGLAFLLATIAEFGEAGEYTWKDYWADLRDNDVAVTAGWDDAYYGRFSGGAGRGDRPLVVSYASSPPAEVIFSETPLDEAPTGIMEAGCFRQIEFAGVLAGTDAPELAAAFIDFMLGVEFQEDIPLNMFVFPANAEARLPEAFVEYTKIPDTLATVAPDVIDANRQRWIEEWDAVMLP
ncbi:MAG TPA: thiamine ABC transporter substrate-binding protein [Acidimicrobiia bacterium]|nr:thiamine ABC transporter substrate-binding protein [Acidimicrobiia bacterium]